MFSSKSHLVFLTAIFVALTAAASLHAGVSDTHATSLTFSRPVALPGVALGSGTYIFEIANPVANHDIVRVLSQDRKIVYLTAFTHEVSRPATPRQNQAVSFAESAPDRPAPISVWWIDGGSEGRQFIYR